MRYDTILFDLDGTLTDPAEGITNSVLHALHKAGLDVPRESLLKFIGPPLMDSYKEYFPTMDPWQGVLDFREYFADKGLFENVLYDDTIDTLKKLKDKGYRLAICTSKPEVHARTIADHFGMTPYLDGIYGANLEETRVKKGDVIEYALEELNKTSPVRNALMVGDRRHDIEGAHENNLQAVGVLCGYGSKSELQEADADFIVPALEDLPILLNKVR